MDRWVNDREFNTSVAEVITALPQHCLFQVLPPREIIQLQGENILKILSELSLIT